MRFTFVNGLTFESARPECLTDGNEQFSFYYVASITKVVVPILLLVLCVAARVVLRHAFRRQWLRWPTKRQHEMIDKLHVYESVVFQFQLCSSWRNAYNLMSTLGQSNTAGHIGQLALVGGLLAILLVIIQLALVVKYLLSTILMVAAQRARDEIQNGVAGGDYAPRATTQSHATAISSGQLRTIMRRILGHSRVDADRLEARTSYIGRRFGKNGAFARRLLATIKSSQRHHPRLSATAPSP